MSIRHWCCQATTVCCGQFFCLHSRGPSVCLKERLRLKSWVGTGVACARQRSYLTHLTAYTYVTWVCQGCTMPEPAEVSSKPDIKYAHSGMAHADSRQPSLGRHAARACNKLILGT